MELSKKSRGVAAVLCFVLGMLGVHRFYVGKTGTGLLILMFTFFGFTFFVSAIWVLLDFINILIGQFKDKQGLVIKNWND